MRSDRTRSRSVPIVLAAFALYRGILLHVDDGTHGADMVWRVAGFVTGCLRKRQRLKVTDPAKIGIKVDAVEITLSTFASVALLGMAGQVPVNQILFPRLQPGLRRMHIAFTRVLKM